MEGRSDLYREALRRIDAGERVALATVIATSGSTPQKAGAALLVLDDGQMRGTIGGGCIEADTWAAARRMMRDDESGVRSFTLADDPDQPGGDVCGGTMDVMIEVLSAAQTLQSSRAQARVEMADPDLGAVGAPQGGE